MVETKRPAPAPEPAAQAPAKRQNVSWSWLWKNVTFSDIRIILVTDGSTPATVTSTTGSPPAAAAAVAAADGPSTAQATAAIIEAETATCKEEGRPEGAAAQQNGHPASTDGSATQADGKPVVLLELPAHKVVVASVSNYFRDRLVAWEKQQQQEQQRMLLAAAAISPGPDAGATSPALQVIPTCSLEEVILPDQLPAAEAVLQFMYNQELPKPVNTMLLITVARLAERWDMPSCTQACLQALSLLTPAQLPANLIGSIMADDLPRSVLDQPLYTPLLEACKQRLVQLFGSVQAVLINDALRVSFCHLPFSAVKLWARLDELKVDSENSVAVLITHWWMHNHPTNKGQQNQPTNRPQSGGGAAPGDGDGLKEQRLAICALVRLNQLSASFFTGVLQSLPWWGPAVEAFNMLCMARALHSSKGALLQQPIRDRLPAAWLAKPRVKDVGQELLHQWVVSKEDLDTLHKEAGSGRTLRESPGLYWSGYVWHLCLSLNSQRDALWVGVRARSAVPAAYAVPALMEAKFTIAVKEASSKDFSRKETLNFGDGAALQPANCNGTPRLLGVPATATARAASQPAAALIIDGKLHLQLTMELMQ